MYAFKHTRLKALGNFKFYTKLLFPLTFFTTFGMFLKQKVNLNLNNRSGKKEKLCRRFISTLFGIANIYSQLQHVYYKAYSFCYKLLNYWFYIFENMDLYFSRFFIINDRWIIEVFLSFFPLLIYLCFIVTVIFDIIIYTSNFSTNFTIFNSYLENINKSQTSLCPTNNISLFGQEEIISVSTTPVSTVTTYKSLIFVFIVAIFSSIFYKKKKKLKSQKIFYPF